jgi:hypothetical protein
MMVARVPRRAETDAFDRTAFGGMVESSAVTGGVRRGWQVTKVVRRYLLNTLIFKCFWIHLG